MINQKYAKAYVEVLELLSYLSEEEYQKIPQEKIDFFEENCDKEYQFSLDERKPLDKQNISLEANSIMVVLYEDYFANENQKKILHDILLLNSLKEDEEKREMYSPEDIFKEKKSIEEKQEENKKDTLIVPKENVITKLIHWIKSIFQRKEKK